MWTDDFLSYYRRELAYLREQGAEFAERHPKVAGRLALHGGESPDPHVERLLESFAFLAARVHREVDQTTPQLAADLLDHLCPALALTLPSMSVAQLRLDPDRGKVTAGLLVPRGTALNARSGEGDVCRFQTAWDIELWPLQVLKARLIEGNGLAVELCADGDVRLNELDIRRLCLHLYGDWLEAAPMYEWLAAGVLRVELWSESQRFATGSCRELGFAIEESILSQQDYRHPGHTLLQEIFAYPRKFHFFEIGLPDGIPLAAGKCELRLYMAQPLRGGRSMRADGIRLGCVPVANLFVTTSEAITLDQRNYEYPLTADWTNAATVEVLRVEDVQLSDPMAERTVSLPPFSSQQHLEYPAPPMYWVWRRAASFRPQGGTDSFISFVDGASRPSTPSVPVVYARVLCSNRRLAEQVPAGAVLSFEKVHPGIKASCLYGPTPQRDPQLSGEQLWRLTSFITLHRHSLFSSDGCAHHLQRLLRLFAGDSARDAMLVHGLLAARATPASLPVRDKAWRGYYQGTDVMLEFDPDAYAGSSPLLLAAGLAHFFARTTAINSFVRTSARLGETVWKQWPPMSGCEVML